MGAASIHVITVVDTDDDSRIAETIDTLAAQTYAHWRFSVVADRPSPNPLFDELPVLAWRQSMQSPGAELAAMAAGGETDWLLLCEPGTVLDPGALGYFAKAVADHREWRMVYVDAASIEAGAAKPAYLKPDFNLELLRAEPYLGGVALVHRDLLTTAELRSTVVPLLIQELAFAAWEMSGDRAVGHIPRLLSAHRETWQSVVSKPGVAAQALHVVASHLHRAGIEAQVEPGAVLGTVAVRYRHHGAPLVSVIIPTKDRPGYIRPCLTSLLSATRYANFEVLVMDNGTTDADARAFLADAAQDPRVRVLDYPRPYNFSAINNAAARQARGEYLLLLNNDTEILHDEWLDELLAQAQRRDVGVVGARLIFQDRKLQHAGVILGMGANGVAEHPYLGAPMEIPGYMNRAQVAQEFSAVTGACLMVRKSVYEEVGGLDERNLAVMYNDIDLCLKVRESGYRVIWTPAATLRHHGSVSLRDPKLQDAGQGERAAHEVATMLERWLPQLARDPAYNPNLSLLRSDFAVDNETHANWGPVHDKPRIMAMAFGSDGSWEHRVRIPVHSLATSARAETAILPKFRDRVRVPSVAEMARENPDVVLLHNCVHDVHLDAISRYRRFNDSFLVFGQDDLMYELPRSNPFHDQVYPDIKQRLHKAIGMCDRLVVSTEPLAEAYRDMATEIVVRPNCLDWEIWGKLHSRRRRGPKPRVGWAGAQQHVGDLCLIRDVVKRTAREVDWVFFGLCFEELVPYVAEVINPVAFERYPNTLAGLDLDLAIAPLEVNRFNECKSNLKVLEYGALGIPVVCTDIAPYQSAPVARVANRTAEWLEAIRARTSNLDHAAREGDALRQWVHEHWLLEWHLDTWLAALSSDSQTVPVVKAGAS